MHNIFDSLLANTYQLDLPMPVISVTKLDLHVEKGSTYFGAIEMYNSAGGFLIGLVESAHNVLLIQEDTIKGNRCVIAYTIDGTQLATGFHEDTILITYNGGEILIPVQVVIEEPKTIKPTPRFIPKPIQNKVSFTCDQKSYQPDETGVLNINNPFDHSITVKMTNGEGYINFSESDFEVYDTKTIEFTFKVTKLDRMLGRVPLKTNPNIEIHFSADINNGHEVVTQKLTTAITEMAKLSALEKISDLKSFHKIINTVIRQYCNEQLTNSKIKSIEEMNEKLRCAINFDRTNVQLRLFYCFFVLEHGDKRIALNEINNLDRFLLYYDKENQDVSDILLLFLEMYKGDQVQKVVNNFKLTCQSNWVKILLKNRYCLYKTNSYEEYRTLYKMGVKNPLIYLEAVCLLNHLPMVPSQEDSFYKSLLLWASRKSVIGVKWLKKLEISQLLLVRNGNVNGVIAHRLYGLEPNKNMLILICTVYIAEKKFDLEAYYFYNKAMSERLNVPDLELAYVQAAYYGNQMLNLDYIKMFFNVEKLDTLIKAYFHINILLQKERYKSLYNFYSKKADGEPIGCFKELTVPYNYPEKLNYIWYLLRTNQVNQIIALNQVKKLEELPYNLEKEIIEQLYMVEVEQAIKMAKRAFDNGCYEPIILKIMGDHYKGTLSDLLHLYGIMNENNHRSNKLEEEILYKGILTRKYPEKVMEVYVSYCEDLTIRAIHEWMLNYIAAQIIIEDVVPPVGVVELLENTPHLEEDMALSLALLKAYTIVEIKNGLIKDKLVSHLMKNGIIFSWYAQLVPDEILGESGRIYHYFEYNSRPDLEVYFYYRLEDEREYQRVRMKHVALGMYIVRIIMFYNEEIQYYIDEKSKEGQRDIKLSDYYIKQDLIELDGPESLFDSINTIEISKEMNDEVSIERTIEHYLNHTKKEIEGVNIL